MFQTEIINFILTYLHDISFMDSCNFVAAILLCVPECKLCHSSRCLFGDKLYTLHHSIHNFMFDTGVFTLSVLTDSHNVYIVIKSLIPFQ